jgi:capsular polysaccharide transport system permease protein
MTDIRVLPPPPPRPEGGPMRRGFRVQANVIGALILRELHTRYGRENIGLIWLVLEPMILATGIALIHSRSPTHFGTDMKPVPFTLIGYCNFITFRGIFSRGEGAVEANLTLLYHRTVTIFDVMLSRALLEAAGTLFAFVLLMGIAIAAGMANLPERPHFLVLGVLTMFLLCFSWSLVVVWVSHDNRSAARLIHPIGYLMMPLSGAFFALKWLPTELAEAFTWVPLSHVFELLRYGQFRSATAEFIDPWYLVAWILGPMIVGLLGISVMRSRIHMP